MLPHRWSRRADTHFSLAHFRKHRHKDGGTGAAAGRASSGAAAGEQKHGAVAEKPALGERLLQAAHAAGLPGRHAAGAHHGGGALTGHVHALAPNVVLAHLRDGLEAVHLYTGRTVCKLLLPTPNLHADVNADGVVDHVALTGWAESSHGSARERQAQCWALVTSGLPAAVPLFNGSICRSLNPLNPLGGFDGGTHVLVAPPAVLRRTDAARTGLARRAKLDTLAFNSRGEVTSFAPDGRRRFQARASLLPHVASCISSRSQQRLSLTMHAADASGVCPNAADSTGRGLVGGGAAHAGTTADAAWRSRRGARL